MENLCLTIPRPGNVCAVGAPKHFGKLLRHLRGRTLTTQKLLADAAGVSEATIQQAEGKPTCEWRAATISDVLLALDELRPLTPDERRDYLVASGLGEEAFTAMERALGPFRRQQATVRAAVRPPQADADLHDLVDALREEFGVHAVRAALRGMAAGMRSSVPAPQMVRIERAPGVKELHPIDPPPPAQPHPKQRRAT